LGAGATGSDGTFSATFSRGQPFAQHRRSRDSAPVSRRPAVMTLHSGAIRLFDDVTIRERSSPVREGRP